MTADDYEIAWRATPVGKLEKIEAASPRAFIEALEREGIVLPAYFLGGGDIPALERARDALKASRHAVAKVLELIVEHGMIELWSVRKGAEGGSVDVRLAP